MKNRKSFASIVALCLVQVQAGQIYQNFFELPAQKKVYDYIVIGGGTAGLVVAHRLAEDKSNSVLVIEAGGSDQNDINLRVPAFYQNTLGTNVDWNYKSIPQTGLNGNRSLDYPSGYVLGGSSALSGSAYTRGSSQMYEKIVKLTGDTGWSWNKLMPYILRNEQLTPPMDGHDTSHQIKASVHGHSGLVGNSVSNYPSSLDPKILAASKELGREFAYIQDMNTGNDIGIGYQLTMTRNGTHESSATAYLRPSFLKEHNIDVVLNTTAASIAPDAKVAGVKGLRFRTVEVSPYPNTTAPIPPRIMFTAQKQIILSAGAIRTPQLLLLSGIGPKQHLDAMGIKTVIDNPSVGDNFKDHYAVQLAFYVDEAYPTPQDREAWLKEWNETRTGPLSSTATNMRGHFRMTKDELDEYKKRFGKGDPAAGDKAAHYELVFVHNNASPDRSTFSILFIDLNPQSYGQVRLNTTNPYDSPLINPNVLNEEADMFINRAAYRAAMRFIKAKTFQGYLQGPVGNTTYPDPADDKAIDDLVRAGGFSLRHPSGTAAMSRKEDMEGVVTPDLKLKGAEGVSIVDASVFPFIPGTHIQVPVYIFAERAADIIKKGRR